MCFRTQVALKEASCVDKTSVKLKKKIKKNKNRFPLAYGPGKFRKLSNSHLPLQESIHDPLKLQLWDQVSI